MRSLNIWLVGVPRWIKPRNIHLVTGTPIQPGTSKVKRMGISVACREANRWICKRLQKFRQQEPKPQLSWPCSSWLRMIFPAVNRARKISRFLASELLPQWLWIRFISSNMLKFCQLLWSNLVKMHSETKWTNMCGSPSNIHLSPPSDPVKRIAVFNLVPLQWNEAEIYVMLPVGEMSCMKKQSRMPTHANRQFVGSGNEAGLCDRDCLRKRTVLPEFPVASGTSCSQRISCLSNVCLVNQQIASILQLPRHTLLWWPFCNFFVRSMRSESWHPIGNASSQSMDPVTAASKKLPKPP